MVSTSYNNKTTNITIKSDVRRLLRTIAYNKNGIGVKYKANKFIYNNFTLEFYKDDKNNKFIIINGNKLPVDKPYFKVRVKQVLGVDR